MSSQVFCIQDALPSSNITFLPHPWNLSKVDNYFHGSAYYATGSNSSISIVFDGISVALFGDLRNAHTDPFKVTIDDGYPYSAGADNPKSYTQWYQSPTLYPGVHTVQLDQVVGYSLDYIVITPGPNTDLDGKTIIVDDSYPEIEYIGNWMLDSETIVTNEAFTPFQNYTHKTTTVGDKLQFSWTGTNISIYGMTNAAGNLNLSVSIDNVNVSTVAHNLSDPNALRANFLLFNSGDLTPDNHTLVMTLTESTKNQALLVDYILYEPSFTTLSTQTQKSSQSGGSQTNIGGIIGGVITALVVLAVLGACVQQRKARVFDVWTRHRVVAYD